MRRAVLAASSALLAVVLSACGGLVPDQHVGDPLRINGVTFETVDLFSTPADPDGDVQTADSAIEVADGVFLVPGIRPPVPPPVFFQPQFPSGLPPEQLGSSHLHRHLAGTQGVPPGDLQEYIDRMLDRTPRVNLPGTLLDGFDPSSIRDEAIRQGLIDQRREAIERQLDERRQRLQTMQDLLKNQLELERQLREQQLEAERERIRQQALDRYRQIIEAAFDFPYTFDVPLDGANFDVDDFLYGLVNTVAPPQSLSQPVHISSVQLSGLDEADYPTVVRLAALAGYASATFYNDGQVRQSASARTDQRTFADLVTYRHVGGGLYEVDATADASVNVLFDRTNTRIVIEELMNDADRVTGSIEVNAIFVGIPRGATAELTLSSAGATLKF